MNGGEVSRERWRELEPLIDAALGLSTAERRVFLDEACDGDGALLTEALALVAACERAEAILPSPAKVAFAPLLAEESPTLPTPLDGRYHIVREIGRGGMAAVHLADDPKHGRQVAVKVLHTDVARLIGRERFMREIEIAARLSHPHILPLHDSGEVPASRVDDPPLLYFVSPFIAGESLRDRLGREPRLSLDDVVRLGVEIALALDYAHRHGVVHLDIKPGNILLQDAHAIVADFGIARAITTAGHASEPAPLLGTPSYMSPEQALGEQDVDGRSDIYSLGCVLYEMATGKRPFATVTPSEAVERAKAPSAPDRAALVEKVPRSLATVILRAISPSKHDRFATAGDLARALGAHASGARARGWQRRGLVVAATLLVAGVAATMWAYTRPALDPNRIVVAPFDAEGPGLSLWREGLVDVMSRNLDGAGPLSAVPATMAVHNWRGRGDAQSARAFGERTGARLVLFGWLLGGGDSVRVNVVLLDAQTGQTLGEFERRDENGRIDRLSDSLTVDVLRELGRSRKIDIARATSSPTASLPALKAYLQGEQFYRDARWDTAQTLFERAVTLDSTFALAYHRLAAVRRWRDRTDVPDTTAYSLMRRMSRHAVGLAPRERLLATVDSLSAEAFFAWKRGLQDSRNYDDEQIIVQRLYSTLEDGLQRYPNDPELLFFLADARAHYDTDVVFGEVDDRGMLETFARVIALDPSFAPAYVTPISLSAYLDGAESARRYIHGYLAVAPPGSQSQFIRLADALLDPPRAAAMDMKRLVDTLPPDLLCGATTLLRHVADSAETLTRIAQALAVRPGSSASAPAAACAYRQAVDGLQFRGHLREARRITTLQAHWLGPSVVYNMAQFGMIPADSVRAEFKFLLSMAPRIHITRLYAWWAGDHDTASIRTYLDQYTAAAHRASVSANTEMLRSGAAAGQAYLILARGDTASALREFLTMRDTLNQCWHENRTEIVRLLVASGRVREAASRLERRWPGTSECSNGVEDVVWTMERARAFERMGRNADALANYTLVADAWRNADTELQPFAREARASAARLRAQLDGKPGALVARASAR